jgi:hypothetical protein
MKKWLIATAAILILLVGWYLLSKNSRADSTVTARTYDVNGAELMGYHMVVGSSTLVLGTKTVTLSGSAAFTSNSSYKCMPTESTGLNLTAITYASGSSFTVLGVGTDAIGWVCVGN